MGTINILEEPVGSKDHNAHPSKNILFHTKKIQNLILHQLFSTTIKKKKKNHLPNKQGYYKKTLKHSKST